MEAIKVLEELKNIRVVVATHVFATGPAQDLTEYLNNNQTKEVLFIGHPLFYDPKLNGSGYDYYKNGLLVKNHYSKIKKIPELISYLKDIILTIYYVITKHKKWDIYVGCDNLNAFSGLLLKRLGFVNKVVYYVIDYNPNRFINKYINSIYHKIDQFCVKYADVTWNLSPRMQSAREKYFGFIGGNQVVVPVGVWLDRINPLPLEKRDKNTIVFMGHVIKKQGIQYVIKEIPKLKSSLPDLKLIIIGDGEYKKELESMVLERKVENCVNFLGFVKDHKDVERIISKCVLAVALYEKYDERGNLTFTNFSDPAKLKVYISLGVPVLTTDVAYNAKELEAEECVEIINEDGSNLAEKISELLDDQSKMERMINKCLGYSTKFNWNLIFEDNLRKLL